LVDYLIWRSGKFGHGRILPPKGDERKKIGYEGAKTLVNIRLIRWTYPVAMRMGFAKGELILEIGYGADCDDSLRAEIKKIVATDFHENSTNEVVDAVLLWFRDGDGDLVDELMDAMAYLSEKGPIWVLTPKVGRDGHVEPSDIQDAAPTCGLSQTSTLAVAKDWTATRLVARKAGKR
jgi:hypothetical protein